MTSCGLFEMSTCRFGPRLTSVVGHTLLIVGLVLFANSYLGTSTVSAPDTPGPSELTGAIQTIPVVFDVP